MGVFLKVRPKNLTIGSHIKSTALIFLYRFSNDKSYIMKLGINKAPFNIVLLFFMMCRRGWGGKIVNCIYNKYRFYYYKKINMYIHISKNIYMLEVFIMKKDKKELKNQSSPKSCVKLSAQYLMVLHLDIISRSIFPLFRLIYQ